MGKKIFLFLFFLFGSFSISYAAESVSFSLGDRDAITGDRILTITYETGADGSLTTTTRISTVYYAGKVKKCEHIPGSSPISTGVADVTIKNDNGVDVMGGVLENLVTSGGPTQHTPMVGVAATWNPINATKFTLDIVNNVVASGNGVFKVTIGQ